MFHILLKQKHTNEHTIEHTHMISFFHVVCVFYFVDRLNQCVCAWWMEWWWWWFDGIENSFPLSWTQNKCYRTHTQTQTTSTSLLYGGWRISKVMENNSKQFLNVATHHFTCFLNLNLYLYVSRHHTQSTAHFRLCVCVYEFLNVMAWANVLHCFSSRFFSLLSFVCIKLSICLRLLLEHLILFIYVLHINFQRNRRKKKYTQTQSVWASER